MFHSEMENEFYPWAQNPGTFPIEIAGHRWSRSPDMNLYNPDYSLIHNDPFESQLSSMVSSPAASAVYGGGGVIQSANNSCYSTPMNSPPKLNLSPFAADPGFAERAARFSCFGGRSFGGQTAGQLLVNDINSDKKVLEKMSDSREESSVSEKLARSEGILRKRKSIPRGKAKVPSKVGVSNNDSDSKRSKSEVSEIDGNGEKQENGNSKLPEAPKDYIHVRARRGQATDSHSLAERVRREKISERMKYLQDLVPGCNKVTGKAIMLDEIINYVQSLQRQVEGLSMKLATVSPRMDSVYMEALLSKEILQSRGIMYSAQSSSSASAAFPYTYQSQLPNSATNSQFCNNLLNNDLLRQNHHNKGFCNSASQISMWEDELHNVVHAHMKMEP